MIWLGCAALVLAGVFFLVGGYNQLMKARQNLKGEGREHHITPQPLEVRHDLGAAQEKDCLNRFQATEREIAAIKKQRDEDDRVSSIHRASIYNKMEQVRIEVSNHTEAVRKELSEKLDDVPDRLVAMLKNTGALD